MNDSTVKGYVKSIAGDEVRIRLEDEDSCHECGLRFICSDKTIVVQDEQVVGEIRPGQQVKIAYRKLVQTSLIVYAIPLIFFFLGLFLGNYFLGEEHEVLLFFTALLGLAMGFGLVHFLNRKLSSRGFRIRIMPFV